MNIGRSFIDITALVGMLPADVLNSALAARRASGQLKSTTPIGKCRELGDEGEYGTVFVGTDRECGTMATADTLTWNSGDKRERIAFNLRAQKKDANQAASSGESEVIDGIDNDVSDDVLEEAVAEAVAELVGPNDISPF